MRDRRLVLGLCPIGKFVFSHAEAVRYKRMMQQMLTDWNIRWVSIEDAVPDGVVRSQADVGPAVRCLKQQGAQALFLMHGNFGTEGAAGVIARDMGLPTLLWGPRDAAPLEDGTRLCDTLCGLFASSKVISKLGTPFQYITNCWPDDPALKQGVLRFTGAAAVARRLRGMRIGLIGQRIDFFWTTIINESELLQRFGIEVLPIDLVLFIRRVKQLTEARRDAYSKELAEWRTQLRFDGFTDDLPLLHQFGVRDALLEVAEREHLDAVALQSFDSICQELGAMVEFGTALAADAGLPLACETDIHGAISAAMLSAVTGDTEPILFADLTARHPQNDHGVLLWHCAFAPSRRLIHAPASVGTHWILPGIEPGSCHWQMQPGDLTVFRFDGEAGRYEAITGECRSIDGPSTQNTWLWVEVNDWPVWEQAFINGPYIHHVAACYGRHAGALQDAFRFIPSVDCQALP